MKLLILNSSPCTHYDGRAVNFLVQAATKSGQQLNCFDPSGTASQLRPGNRIEGLVTALHYQFVPENAGDNCITGILRSSFPANGNSAYRELFQNNFVALETIDGLLFLYHNTDDGIDLAPYNGQIVNVCITGGLYLEMQLSDQYAI